MNYKILDKHGLVFIFPLVLLSCTTSSQIHMPDGKKGYSIKCNGNANNWANCYEEASKVCGSKGYKVVSKNGESLQQNGFMAKRSLFVQCKS